MVNVDCAAAARAIRQTAASTHARAAMRTLRLLSYVASGFSRTSRRFAHRRTPRPGHELRGAWRGARAQAMSAEERRIGAIGGGQTTEWRDGEARDLAGANAVVGSPRCGIGGGVGVVRPFAVDLRRTGPFGG